MHLKPQIVLHLKKITLKNILNLQKPDADCYKLAQSARFFQTDTTTEKNRIQTVKK